MSSRRVYRRRDYIPRYVPRASKYQFVPFSINFSLPSDGPTPAQGVGDLHVLVPQSQVAGIRKVKNFSINFATDTPVPLLFAIMYLPEGTTATNTVPRINPSGSADTFVEMLEANQWVIGCGSIVQGAINQFRTRMSRNLNNGDSVWLYVWKTQGNDTAERFVNATGNYAIRYN